MEQQTHISMHRPKPPKSYLTERRRSALTAYLYISPFFLLFAIFGVYPIFFTFYLSFFKWDALGPKTFVGFDNFKFILTDTTFWTSFSNTLIMGAMGTIPQLIIALLLAVALNSALTKFKQIFRVVYFMPNITSIVAVTLVFSAIFANRGMMNGLITSLGFNEVSWNTNWWGVKIAISSMVFWRWLGYNMIIYYSGLQSVPEDLYEAAKIDGAGSSQQLFYITIPMLRPFVLFTVLTSTIGSLQLFTEPYVFLGQGGTGSTRIEGLTMVVYLYSEAFRTHFFGTAAATAVILFFITILFSIVNMWLGNRVGGDTGGEK